MLQNNQKKKLLLVCPKCNHLYPLIKYMYQSTNKKVMIHIKCYKCLNQIYDYEEYIELITNIPQLPPYKSNCFNCLNESNKCIFYCPNCSILLCSECSINHNQHTLKPIPSFFQLAEDTLAMKAQIFHQLLSNKQQSKENHNSQISIIDKMIIDLQKLKDNLKQSCENECKCISLYELILNLIYDSFESTKNEFNHNIYEILNSLSVSYQQSKTHDFINTFLTTTKDKIENENLRLEHCSIYDDVQNMTFINYNIKESLIHTISTNQKQAVYSIIQLKNGNLASANGNFISFWNKNTLDLIKTIVPNYTKITSLYEITTTNQLAACTFYVSIAIIHINTFQTISVLNFHSNITWDFIRLSNGLFSSCTEDNTILIIDYKFNGIKLTLKGHQEPIKRIIETKDGCIVSCSWDKSIKKWSVSNGECLLTLQENGYSYPLDIIEIDDDCLISCGSDGRLKKWSLTLRKIIGNISIHSSKIWKMCLLNDGHIATCSRDHTLAIVNINHMVMVSIYKLNSNNRFKCIVQLKDGRLVSGDKEGLIKIWKYL